VTEPTEPRPGDLRTILEGNAEYLRELKALLDEKGIRAFTGPLPSTAWGTKAWLAVAGPDVPRATQVYEEHLDAMVDNTGLTRNKAVADFDAEETTCPACMTPFKTANADRCPDCGLRFR
jgi:hypothetical protein